MAAGGTSLSPSATPEQVAFAAQPVVGVKTPMLKPAGVKPAPHKLLIPKVTVQKAPKANVKPAKVVVPHVSNPKAPSAPHAPKMAKLSTSQRKALSPDQFVFPEKAPKSGSYPIPDRAHAADALARSAGKPEHAAVRKAVCGKFRMGCGSAG